MKIAIVGCGAIAFAHVPYILEQKRHPIVGICDQDRKRADALAHRFHLDAVYTNLAQLLHEKKPEVVHVLTPPQTHLPIALQAIKAGAHVLVEKPMALSVEEADAMIAAADAQGVKLCVDHTQIFEPVILKAQHLLASGRFGKIIAVESYYGFNCAQAPERRWEDGLSGGLFEDVAPHPLSLMLQFLQDPLELQTYALATGALGPEVPDELRVLMKSPNAIGTLVISFAVKPYLNFLKIYGSEGVLNVDLANLIISTERLRPLPKALARGLMTLEQSCQLAAGAIGTGLRFALGRMKSYQGMGNLIRRFYGSIEKNEIPPISGKDGRRIIEVFERIRTQLPAKPRTKQRYISGAKERPPVFVSGASGFLGSHLVRRLNQQGERVKALVRPSSPIDRLKDLPLDLVNGDLGDVSTLNESLQGCDIVYHCAAATNGSWYDYVESTIRGTENILTASERAGVKRVVYISTLSVYAAAQLKDHDCITEDSALEPHPEKRNYYAQSKIEAEKIVLAYSREKGLPVVILRPGIIYGPGGQVFFASIGFSLRDRLFFVMGPGDQLLPLTYVDNVVDAICLAATQKEAQGKIYNIVDDEKITNQQYLNELIHKLDLSASIVHVPVALFHCAATLLELQRAIVRKATPPLLTRYRLACATKNLQFDTSRAKEDLRWMPNISLEEGLTRTFQWYREQS